MKKGDVCILALLLCCAVIWFAADFSPQSGTLTAEILVNGEAVETVRLPEISSPYTLTVSGCTLRIEPDGVTFTEADCPDKLCVRHGKLHTAGDTMACLPNRVVVRLYARSAADALTW